MPTRPSSTIALWGSNASPYVAPGKSWDGGSRRTATGYTGLAESGYTPESPTQAQFQNEHDYRLSEWGIWVTGGSDSPIEERAIVERDASGYANLAGATFGGVSNGLVTAVFESNGSNFYGSTIAVFNDDAETAVRGDNTAAVAAGLFSNAGTGPGARGVAASGPGLQGESTSGNGVEGIGGSSGHGVFGDVSDAFSAGVFGQSNTTGGATGVRGTHDVAASTPSSGAGVEGTATNGATAVRGVAANGHGVWAESDTTTPVRAAMHVVPQDATPSSPSEGDVQFHSGEKVMRIGLTSGASRVVHDSVNGVVAQSTAELNGSQNSSTLSSKASVSLTGLNAPRRAGTVVVRATFNVRNAGAALNAVRALIRRDPSGSPTTEAETYIRCAQTNAAVTTESPNAYEHSVTITAVVSVSAGDVDFDLQMATITGGGTGITYENLVMTIHGVY